jgi:hypothetical protein
VRKGARIQKRKYSSGEWNGKMRWKKREDCELEEEEI